MQDTIKWFTKGREGTRKGFRENGFVLLIERVSDDEVWGGIAESEFEYNTPEIRCVAMADTERKVMEMLEIAAKKEKKKRKKTVLVSFHIKKTDLELIKQAAEVAKKAGKPKSYGHTSFIREASLEKAKELCN